MSTFVRSLLLGSLVAIGAPAALVAQDLTGQVATMLAQAESAPVNQLYDLAAQLADLAPEKNPDAFQSAVLKGAKEAGQKARLCAALA